MTTPKPLPADIEGLLREYGDASEDFGMGYEMAEDIRDAALEKLTALLSGYVEKAKWWDHLEVERVL